MITDDVHGNLGTMKAPVDSVPPRSRWWALSTVAVVLFVATSCGDNATLQVDRAQPTTVEAPTAIPSASPVTSSPSPVAPDAESTVADVEEVAATPEVTRDAAPAEPIAASPCTATLPVTPAAEATGVVTFDLTGDWSAYNYGELYVLDEQGDSALVAGKPAVRNRDSFAFVINDSMYVGPSEADVRVSFNGDPIVSCNVEFIDLPTVTADEGGGSGY